MNEICRRSGEVARYPSQDTDLALEHEARTDA